MEGANRVCCFLFFFLWLYSSLRVSVVSSYFQEKTEQLAPDFLHRRPLHIRASFYLDMCFHSWKDTWAWPQESSEETKVIQFAAEFHLFSLQPLKKITINCFKINVKWRWSSMWWSVLQSHYPKLVSPAQVASENASDIKQLSNLLLGFECFSVVWVSFWP